MKKYLFIVLFLFILHELSIAQTSLIQWQSNYGGTGDDQANAIQPTHDGGYIIAGSSTSMDGEVTGHHYSNTKPEDFWLTKIDACGNLQWQKSLGGTGKDIAYSVIETSDKKYLVAGFTNSTDGDITVYHGGASDYWVVKLDTLGNIIWQKTFGGLGEDGAQSIKETSNGNYIVAGWSSSNGDTLGDHDFDYWVVKLDTAGNVKWQKLYGGLGDDTPYSIATTTDGGYVVAGYSQSNSGDVTGHHGSLNANDYWVIKIDSLGILQWQKSLGGSAKDNANDIIQTSDKGYIIAGFTTSNNGDVSNNYGGTDYWLVKLDSVGNIQWQKNYGGTSNDQANAIHQLANGNYIVTGVSYSNNHDVSGNHGGVGDYWAVYLSANGIIQWQKTLGGSSSDYGNAIQLTKDGGLVVAGASNSNDGDITSFFAQYDYWIVKLTTISGSINICSGNTTTLTASGADSFTWSPGGIISSSITITPTSNITYTLTASTGTCAVNNSTINLIVNPLPAVTFSTLGFADTVCSTSNSQNITGGVPSGGVYSGTGVSGQIFNPSSAGIGTYTLTYIYTDGNNCSNNASHDVTVDLCPTTEINPLSSFNQITIYPNPFLDDVQITAPNTIKKVTIYDIIGHKVKEFSFANSLNKLLLTINELMQGVYFVEIMYTDNISDIRKITKQ